MSGIQVILITGVAFLGIYFIIRIKKRVVDILFMFFLIALAILFILWPDLTNIIAHKMGVGRGTDLIFYLSILLFWFILVKLYIRIRRLEQMITTIIRKEALTNTDIPAEKDNH